MNGRKNNQNRRSTAWLAWLAWLGGLCCLMLLSVSGADAQQWKYVYGPDNGQEDGFKRVAPVYGLCTSQQNGGVQGYISIGTSYSRDANGDVYVVRTNNLGAAVWERTYDILNNFRMDVGQSIIELADGSGFALTGMTDVGNGNQDIFIMKIDCAGNVVWTTTYGNGTWVEFSHDIIETTTGNQNLLPIPTSAGDLVIAGSVLYTVGAQGPINMDAYLLRVTANGAMIWDRTYDGPTPAPGLEYQERFLGLTEATPQGTAPTGDIIAVGESEMIGNRLQGYVARVDGDNGTYGGTVQQNVAHFGGGLTVDTCDALNPDNEWTNYGDESFRSVIELQNPAEVDASGVPNVVMVGNSTTPMHSDLYAVKLLGGDPCTPAVERLIGEGLAFGTNEMCQPWDEAWDVREVTWEMSGSTVSQWDLALTGHTTRRVTDQSETDMFLLTIAPGNLQPILGGINMLYGQTPYLDEYGYSLDVIPAIGGRTEGFILCGSNAADPMGVGDPLDMYLVKTGNTGAASATGQCEIDKPWSNASVSWATCISPTTTTWATETDRSTKVRSHDTDDEICLDPEKRVVQGSTETSLAFRIAPNLITAGESIAVEDIRNGVGAITIRMFDAHGRELLTAPIDAGTTGVAVSTYDLSSGMYIVSLEDSKGVRKSTRVTIMH